LRRYTAEADSLRENSGAEAATLAAESASLAGTLASTKAQLDTLTAELAAYKTQAEEGTDTLCA